MLVLHKNICCDPSSEPSRDGSDEGSQHMVSRRSKKNYHQILPLIYSSGKDFASQEVESSFERFHCSGEASKKSQSWFPDEIADK